MLIGAEFVVENINSHLPEQIRVLGMSTVLTHKYAKDYTP